MSTQIEVTQEDIQHGIPRDGTYCPIALAIKRHLPPERYVYVGAVALVIREGKLVKEIEIPPDILKWIKDFDRNKLVKPITIVLEI